MNKLCRDCANVRRVGYEFHCYAGQNMVDDLVHGGMHPHFLPDFLRESDSHCGVEARWFSPQVVTVGMIK